eukprot:TRINITY_DN4187_c0_g1_i12.p1 TRINITY_DN4187_c0_g1~~TRINITY_DN4187_c0_g1_i12.p1  ORF type:complete len:240 (+),score=26.47 TRINITY_DN4187_c0_g1_i12:29-721(+)
MLAKQISCGCFRSRFLGSQMRFVKPSYTSCFRSRNNRVRQGYRLSNSTSRRKITQCSILGVGAPEAVLVAVVALIVFGPKGLAEAAKSLGQALRSFQPTIKELTQVTSDIRNTLEEEIGLDDIRRDLSGYPPSPPRPSVSQQINQRSGDVDKVDDENLSQMRKESEQAAWGGKPALNANTPVPDLASNLQNGQQQQQQQVKEGQEDKGLGDLSGYSLQDLEAELAKRKKQ